jgi:hypothetical protein
MKTAVHMIPKQKKLDVEKSANVYNVSNELASTTPFPSPDL